MSKRTVCIALFLLVFLNGAYVMQRWGANQISRISLLYAMVHEHGVSIDTNAAWTVDKATANGRTYSDKAPGTAFLALPSFAATHLVLLMLRISPSSYQGVDVVQWIATAGSSGWFAALGAVAFWLLLTSLLPPATALAAAAALALGTLQLPYSGQLFSHASTMGLLTVALLLAAAPRDKKRSGFGEWRKNNGATALMAGVGTAMAMLPLGGGAFTVGVLLAMIAAITLLTRSVIGMADGTLPAFARDVACGLACDMAVTGEYPAAVAAAGIGLLALRDRPARAWPMLLGAASPLLLYGAYNAMAFGSPFSMGYQHNGYAWMQDGFLGLSLRFNADALYALLISQGRGLFFWSPFLLLALPGYPRLWRASRPLFWMCLLAPLITLSALCVMSSPYGGSAVGPRYLAPAIPFLALAAAYGLQSLPRFGRALIVLSVALNVFVTLVNAQTPEFIASPFFAYYMDRALAGSFMTNLGTVIGLGPAWSVLPLVALNAAALRWLLRGFTPTSPARGRPGRGRKANA